jgi:hypothetical protein
MTAWATGGSAGQGHAGRSESYNYGAIGNLTSKGGVIYTYPAPGSARPHAVIGTSNGGFTRSLASSLRSERTAGLRGNTISTLRVTASVPPPISRAAPHRSWCTQALAGQPPMGL